VNVNNTKSFIGHAMGAAGALELAGNLPSFDDAVVHPTINIDELDPECNVRGLVINEPGVVGEHPLLAPGDVHQYQSFCVLKSRRGHMEGTYQLVRGDGTPFEAIIPRFELEAGGQSGPLPS
jgi:hypothetical protein